MVYSTNNIKTASYTFVLALKLTRKWKFDQLKGAAAKGKMNRKFYHKCDTDPQRGLVWVCLLRIDFAF